MTWRARFGLATVLAVCLGIAACGSGDDDGGSVGSGVGQGVGSASSTSTTATTAPAAPTRTLQGVTVGLREVAELEAPIDLAARGGDPALYVAERAGVVRRIEITTRTNGAVSFRLERGSVLDIGSEVITDGERGLLGIVFSATAASSTSPSPAPTETSTSTRSPWTAKRPTCRPGAG